MYRVYNGLGAHPPPSLHTQPQAPKNPSIQEPPSVRHQDLPRRHRDPQDAENKEKARMRRRKKNRHEDPLLLPANGRRRALGGGVVAILDTVLAICHTYIHGYIVLYCIVSYGIHPEGSRWLLFTACMYICIYVCIYVCNTGFSCVAKIGWYNYLMNDYLGNE
ncbi:hypothetical protein EYC84_011041 [Monilinia fructicola]|uniref:Uncharacterized protein n=1 Tax=Monilinia fructicola TaxID=38448 RepID=A0A5M9J823_MONFR|nr:hypothetical protein EYC84_011041 [Monilinia fructicola]